MPVIRRVSKLAVVEVAATVSTDLTSAEVVPIARLSVNVVNIIRVPSSVNPEVPVPPPSDPQINPPLASVSIVSQLTKVGTLIPPPEIIKPPEMVEVAEPVTLKLAVSTVPVAKRPPTVVVPTMVEEAVAKKPPEELSLNIVVEASFVTKNGSPV